MGEANFGLVYDGPALTGNEMSVRDLAPALLAFAEVLEQANSTINQDRARVALKVRATFKTGCFGVDFSVVQSLTEQFLGLFRDEAIADARQLLEALGLVATLSGGGLIHLLKWLRNRKIKEVIFQSQNRALVVLEDGEQRETEQRVIALLRNYKLRQAFEQAVAQPLDKPGIETVAFMRETGEAFVTISREDGDAFVAPQEAEEDILDNVREELLHILNIAFKNANKWRFGMGEMSFFATMSDAAFLQRVENGEESFRAGDILRVRLRKRQSRLGMSIHTEYTVEEVLEHIHAPGQLSLLVRQTEDAEWNGASGEKRDR